MSASSYALHPARTERTLRSLVFGYVVFLVALPMVAVVGVGLSGGIGALWSSVTAPVARSAIWLTVWTGLIVAILNVPLGTATAWVLARYAIPGRALLSALVDLPLAVPTLVAGVMIAVIYGPGSLVGETTSAWGVQIMYAPPAIILALLFVTLPFVVRAVEPVLEQVDPAEVEAAEILGASRLRTFRTVFLPAIAPAAISGSIRSLGRAIGEFGSIVVVAGNIPFETLSAPVYIFGEIESGAPRAAAAVSTVLLLFALLLHAGATYVEQHLGARDAQR
jgi:sulfate transport system permease protein